MAIVLILYLNIIKRSLMKSKDLHLYNKKEEYSNVQWTNKTTVHLLHSMDRFSDNYQKLYHF